MKVYVLVASYPNDDVQWVEGVYTTMKLAKDASETYEEGLDRRKDYEILVRELDE